MSLPGVNINFSNGALGGVSNSDDNLFLMLFYALDAAFAEHTVTRADDLLSTVPDSVKAVVADFYAQAGEGVSLVVKGVATQAASLSTADVSAVMENTPGISGIFFVNVDTEATDEPSSVAEKINAIGVSLLSALKCPVFCVANAGCGDNDVAGNSTDLKGLGYERAAIVIGNFVASVSESGTATPGRSIIGLVAGRLAKNEIQVKCSRVKDGALTSSALMMPSTTISGISNTVADEFYTKGYIIPRTITGKSGYYITDDVMCVSDTSDYRFITWRRTIDRAYRVAYATLVQHLNEEIPVTLEGYIVPQTAASWEQEIVSALYNSMTVKSQLSVDPANDSDKGCKCSVPWQQCVTANSSVNVTIQVKPYGYAQFINVQLGFLIE